MIQLTGITWITTYNCNLACDHCFFETRGPKRYMNPELVDMVLSDLKHGDKMFWQHLSGGEIFLDSDKLFDIIGRINKHFPGNIGISTNGMWAKDVQTARTIARKLKTVGVNGVAVSADYYHQQLMDISFPKRAIEVIVAEGLKVHSYVMGARLDCKVANAEEINRECDRIAVEVKGDFEISLATPTVRCLGKGTTINQPKKTGIPQEPCTSMSECLGKRSPFKPAMVWIDPYGNVMICYGLTIGNIYEKSFNEIIEDYDAKANEVTRLIAEEGPKGLYELAQSKGYKLPINYFDECDLCYQCRKALQKKYPNTLTPAECYV